MSADGRRYAWSCLIAILLMILLGIAASLPPLARLEVVFSPGAMLAAIPFREGLHSDWPVVWLALAALVDLFIFSWLVMLVWTLVTRSRHTQRDLPERGKNGLAQ
jgi:hypothetical protein